MLTDDENIVFAIAAGAGFAFGNAEHRLHRHHHARFDYGLDILTQFQPGFAAVIIPS